MSDPRTLVVVNDDPTQLHLACALLERAGYTARAATRVADALALLDQYPDTDGLITDLHMPEIDGWRFCRLLRSPSYEHFNQLPILVVSATFSGADAERITSELGANGFLAAPYAPAALLRMVEAMLAGKSHAPSLDLMLVCRDTDVRTQLGERFSSHGYTVHVAADSAEAIDLLGRHKPGAVVLEHELPDGGAEELLARLKQPLTQTVVLVTHPTHDRALPLRLMQLGADGLIPAPFDPDYAVECCERARRRHALLRVEDLLEDRTLRLRDSERQLRTIFEAIPELVLIYDTQGRILRANSAANTALNQGETLVGRLVADFLMPSDASRVIERIEQLPQGTSRCYETCYVADGRVIDVEVTERPFQPLGQDAVLSVARDICDRRRSEKERVVLATALEQAVETIVVTDPDGIIEYVNPAFERATGHDREHAVGRHIDIVRGGDRDDPAWVERRRTIANGEVWRGRLRHQSASGAEHVCEGTVAPVRDESGAIVHYVGVDRDVIDQLELEHALEQAKKMEAIGTLAGGIAHDFNNHLTGILGYANLLGRIAPDGTEIEEMARVIESSAERAAQLTRQLLGFARRGKHRHVPVDLHETIQQVVLLLSRTIDKNIRIETRFNADPAALLGDPTQMEQAVLNLALNARDAMSARAHGELIFSTAHVSFDDAYCANHPGSKPGRYVMLSVSDNGCGMPPEVQGRIFEPFFTTKAVGEGTGMGLSMTYGIVKNHGGTIRVYSEPDRGTNFRMYLPLDTTLVEAAVPAERRVVRGTGRILLVDDEEIVRQTAAAMLRQLGYEVTALADGEEAVLYYGHFADSIDLILLDMIMPGLDGHACYERIRAIRSDAAVVLSTGFGLNETAQAILDLGVRGFVQKPYRMDELSRIVAAVLAGDTCHNPAAVA